MRKILLQITVEPALVRCLAVLPDPVEGHRGPTLGRAMLRYTSWVGEIDLEEPATARMFEGTCVSGGHAGRRAAARAAEASGRAALARSTFDAEAAAAVYGREGRR